MDITKTLKEYLNELSSSSPTPGGGNVSALCGALASSLGTMVCNLTAGKKKYAAVENEILDFKNKLESLAAKFIELAAKDNAAFDKVMDAFHLPKETEKEKEFRSQKIDDATFGAAEIPAEVIRTCRDTIPLIDQIAKKGNQNSLSDTGVAALLLSTAAQGAFLNVLINCVSLKNQTIASEVLKTSEILTEEVKDRSASIIERITSSIRQS